MNRIFFSCSLIFILFLFPFAGLSQDTETGVDGYEHISEAIKHPEKATRIWVTGDARQLNYFAGKALLFNHLEAFKIKDGTSDAELVRLFDVLSKTGSIREIELTFNDFRHIPPSIASFRNLEKLIIWGSPNLDYTALFKDLSSLKKLRSLELNSNGFTTLPPELKGLQQLEQFSITDNEAVNYSDLVDKLSALPLLKGLSLEVNAITQLPANIVQLKSLTKLNISNNYISSFPEKMGEMKALDSLQADGNLFVNYTDEFNKLKGLSISYLSVDGGLSEEEKAELLRLFPKARVDEIAGMEEPEDPSLISTAADLFQPLVPALAVPKTNYIVDAANGAELSQPSGSTISIPANAFVNKDNQPVTGNISISYREFRDPMSIAFSGIPMIYTKDNISYPMESAGMFQINASKDDQPVFLKSGKSIDVNIVTNDTTNNYNTYHIDPETKEWVDEGKKGTIHIAKPRDYRQDSLDYYASKTVELSQAWRRYNQIIHEDDTVLFKDRFYDTSYWHLQKMSLQKRRSYMRFVRITRYKQENSLNKKPKKDEIWFNISNVSNLVNGTPVPELRAFNGMTWIYDGDETQKEFSSHYLRRKRYSDVRIERNGSSFNILLKEKNGVLTIPAHPVSKYKGSLEKAEKANERRYRNYVKALTRRETKFNRGLAAKQQSVYKYNLKVWQSLKPVMSDSEKTMTFERWMQYYNSMIAQDTTTRFQRSSVFVSGVIGQSARKISVTQFGYYNCDRPVMKIVSLPVNLVDAAIRFGYKALKEPKEYATINAAYFDMKDNRLAPKQVMIIDKKINSVSYLGSGATMTIAVNSPKNLIAVMQDGSVGIFSENKFKELQLSDKSGYSFQLTVYGPNDLDAIRRYLRY